MSSIITIQDADDPRIAAYQQVRERDLIGRHGLFIAEGAVVLRMLLRQCRFRVQSLFLAEDRCALLAEYQDVLTPDTPIYVASSAVMDKIVGFPIHRGILAVGEVGAPLDARALLSQLPKKSLVLGLSAIANHDNMGGLFRNAAAFGVGAILLDHACCDPLYRKAIRVSVGAALHVPFASVKTAQDLVQLCANAGFEIFSLSPAGQQRLTDVRPPARTALLLGAEGAGLESTVLQTTQSVRIDMMNGFDSLNVATTSGIALHHLQTQQ